MRKLELLAPAKNLACGIAAIDHGADAVYIGADRFGARAAAGNSVADIEALCSYAHRFGAKVYVTINTIIYEEELAATRDIICRLAASGADALLVQDMAVVEIMTALRRENADMKLPALHASTQTDNRTAEKVAWLKSTGFERAVLARELSAAEIAEIHGRVPDMELEVFAHGALCVSYSGVCYASQHCFHRSANRGECAQFCRMKFDLIDSDGREIEHQRHLLSLKDMNRIDDLELLADAGACSFKIEGRLKEADYVKNVVSAYSKRLNEIIARRPQDYRRASLGKVEYAFEPDLKKTFNRGYTDYFLHGRQPDIYSPDTPKALGEYVGRVKELRNNSFNVAGTAVFSNGDGLCFINDEHELEGFRVNRVEGNRLFPLKMPAHLRPRFALYRNNDEAFGKILSQRTAVRKIPISIAFGITENGFSLSVTGEGIVPVTKTLAMEKQKALKPQRENILNQLGKLGNTPYEAQQIEIREEADKYFVPSSRLAELRRSAMESIMLAADRQPLQVFSSAVSPVKYWQPEYEQHPYLFNVSNRLASRFYADRGMRGIASAFETSHLHDTSGASRRPDLLMQCRHCLRFSLGYCVKHGGKKPFWREPLYLRLADGRRFRLQFNCKECQMNLYAEN